MPTCCARLGMGRSFLRPSRVSEGGRGGGQAAARSRGLPLARYSARLAVNWRSPRGVFIVTVIVSPSTVAS